MRRCCIRGSAASRACHAGDFDECASGTVIIGGRGQAALAVDVMSGCRFFFYWFSLGDRRETRLTPQVAHLSTLF